MTTSPESAPSATTETTSVAEWKKIVAEYQEPSLPRAIWQIANTFIPYAGLWYLMYLSLSVSYWLTLPLAILAGGFTIRIFIVFHDCGHGSYFKSKLANDILGFISGMLTLTPYFHWRWEHSLHHATSGDLDRRGTGDIWTMTVQEYIESSRWKRFAYRLARNPVILFVIAPLYLFLFGQRFASAKANRRERYSVWWMNFALLVMASVMSWIFGIKAYVVLQLFVTAVAGSVGVWLFYVQHQFEGVYWARHEEWEFEKGAVDGSSFYKLPRLLQWITGSIGYHHIHHLSPKIPNYNLEKCYKENPMFQNVKHITLKSSLRSLSFRLWDEEAQQLVGYSAVAAYRKRHGMGVGTGSVTA